MATERVRVQDRHDQSRELVHGCKRLRRLFEPVIRRGMHFYWRFSRAATLGARAMVIDGTGRIFLIKHSYVDGWHLPGGGVETGETLLEALTRELAEEGNIQLGARRNSTASTSTSAYHGATMWRSSSFATSGRTETRGPTTKSSRTASSPSTRCRKTQRAPPAPGWRKYLVARPSASCGEVQPNRARSCGAAKSSCGPTGTMPVGFTCRWLP